MGRGCRGVRARTERGTVAMPDAGETRVTREEVGNRGAFFLLYLQKQTHTSCCAGAPITTRFVIGSTLVR